MGKSKLLERNCGSLVSERGDRIDACRVVRRIQQAASATSRSIEMIAF